MGELLVMGVIAWWILWELCAGVMVSRRPCMHMWGYSAQFWVVGFIGGSTEFLVGVIFFLDYIGWWELWELSGVL